MNGTVLIRTLTLISLSAVALLARLGFADAPAKKPNILFILADDVGIEPIGCYGGQSFATPHIDHLANSGLRFQHCYSMPVCHPTRICFLTGRYPRTVGNPKWGSFPKDLESQTIAQVMRRSGYATAVAGKWQLTLLGKNLDHPRRLGFDEYCLFGWHEGGRYHDPLLWQNGRRRQDTHGEYGPDLYVDFLIDFMNRHRDSPFFAFYSMALCHDVTDDLKTPVTYAPGKGRYLNYGEMVASMDACVGRLVESLENLGLRENTWIVFSGDNGTAAGSIARAEPNSDGNKKWRYVREPVIVKINGKDVRGGKGSLTDRGTRVPLIVSPPESRKRGQVVDDLVDFSDFLPTFAELGGGVVTADAEINGISFAPRLLGQGQHARSWAYAEGKGKFWVRDNTNSTATAHFLISRKTSTKIRGRTSTAVNCHHGLPPFALNCGRRSIRCQIKQTEPRFPSHSPSFGSVFAAATSTANPSRSPEDVNHRGR